MKSLREALGEIQDDRAWCIYPLEGMLTVVVLVMLCGKNSVKGIARWAREYRWEYAERVGFPRDQMPSLGSRFSPREAGPSVGFTLALSPVYSIILV